MKKFIIPAISLSISVFALARSMHFQNERDKAIESLRECVQSKKILPVFHPDDWENVRTEINTPYGKEIVSLYDLIAIAEAAEAERDFYYNQLILQK